MNSLSLQKNIYKLIYIIKLHKNTNLKNIITMKKNTYILKINKKKKLKKII